MDYEKDNLLSETRDNWRIGYAKKLLAFGVSDECRSALEKEFPELKESEDEKIRKAIGAAICGTTAEVILEANGVKLVDALAYLEKHKEQQPAEWSEEDMEMKRKILKYLSNSCNVFEYEEIENWLNNPRPQPHWKPSKE